MDSEYDQRITSSFSQLKSCLSHESPALMRQLETIRDQAQGMTAYAHEYDFADVKANGFRVGIEYSIRLFEYGVKHFGPKTGKQADESFRQMVTLFEAGGRYFTSLREATSASKCLVDGNVDILSAAFAEYFSRDGMDAGFGPMSGFFLDGPEDRVCYLFYLVIGVIAGGSLTASFKSMIDPEFRRDQIRREYNCMRVEHLKWIDVVGDNWYVRRVAPLLTFGYFKPAVTRDIHIPRQERFKILCDVDQQSCDLVMHESVVNSSSVLRCRLQLDTRKESRDGTVILHTHGGGFVMGSADNHECYDRGWIMAVPGVAMVSVDFDLSPESQFPVAVQQILDAYLFLLSDNAEQVIGYKPKRVMMIGDSSGALMALSVIVILNDLRRKFSQAKRDIIMPIGLLAVYPSFMCVPFTTPSLLLSAIHPELPFPAFLTMVSAYVPFKDHKLNNAIRCGYTKDKISRWQLVYDWLTSKPEEYTNGWHDYHREVGDREEGMQDMDVDQEQNNNNYREDVWWNQSSEATRKRMQDWKLIRHPYVSPLLHPDLKSLKDIQLSVFALSSDPILDHAVEVCKAWGGPVNFTVWTDVMHAFLPFVACGGKYEAHNNEIIQEIKRVIGYQA